VDISKTAITAAEIYCRIEDQYLIKCV